MGDEVLKKLYIFLMLFALACANDVTPKNVSNANYQELDRLFQAINKKRYGLTQEQINTTKDPFMLETEKQKIKKDDANSTTLAPVYALQGIINNKANINGIWYNIDDKINEYKLKQINSDSVVLDNVGNKLKLTLEKGNKNVTIKAY